MTTDFIKIPPIVGLTGGIGCGKSAAREQFSLLGVPCLDADIVARDVHQTPGHPALDAIFDSFPSVRAPDGRLERGSMRSLFALNPHANELLKNILRPHVMNHMVDWARQQSSSYVIWESALFVEEGTKLDRLLVVDSTVENQISRVQQRNPNWSVDQIRAIIAIQSSRASRIAVADDVIENNGSAESLTLAVQSLHCKYLEIFGESNG